MRRAQHFEDFRRAPVGAYLVSSGFAYWCPEPELYGFALWGKPEEGEMRQLFELVDVGLGGAVHDSVIDLSRLRYVDTATFALVTREIACRREACAARIRRQARVRPSGLVGAIVAGLDVVAPAPYPTTIHTALADAVASLGRSEELFDALDQIAAEGTGELPIVEQLRRVLVPSLRDATIGSAAQALGLSARTLQRRLQHAGTTFQAEVSAAQLRAAEALLSGTDTKLETVARQVGFRSLTSFCTMFRRVRGLTPSAYRRIAHRSAAPAAAVTP